jgi:hypothetical protein
MMTERFLTPLQRSIAGAVVQSHLLKLSVLVPCICIIWGSYFPKRYFILNNRWECKVFLIHTTKAYSESGGKVALIFNLGTRWRSLPG